MLPGLTPGERLPRREVHARYGGRQQGGIGPSSRTNVVLFFTNPAIGQQHGYYDGWDTNGLFHYVGEGQRGDQQLTQGNKAILNHAVDGRTLEGFLANGPTVTYLGEFELVEHYFTDAHETGDPTTLRQVVVFKLRPLTRVPVALPNLPFSPTSQPRVETVPVEEHHTERSFVSPDREPYELERRESALVTRYKQHLLREGHTVSRLRVVPPGESQPLYSDLWVETTRELIEAKSTVTREQLRMAVGQLLDYGRFADAKTHAILVPSRPRPDLLAYVHSAGIRVIYQDKHQGWGREDPPVDEAP
ncbi:hypothetical protein [Streptoalloteichus hindustanus]|uniref:ScoMcrA-like SRA domain-containing protein n=1 Tax=Streptoalloteichus hindustanus TaxID=2017 RepID=A0A1M5L0M3_STRHI|nr:hypothetical protein [Streptoalloteichus hindustanus]SHG58536.1 hypothetical protein SAMN05444320_110126 [Streptoalloteichus hindustanus]